jgi:hypothetical protein
MGWSSPRRQLRWHLIYAIRGLTIQNLRRAARGSIVRTACERQPKVAADLTLICKAGKLSSLRQAVKANALAGHAGMA